jgi:hypothetical protein
MHIICKMVGRMNGKWKLRGLGKLGKQEAEHIVTGKRWKIVY